MLSWPELPANPHFRDVFHQIWAQILYSKPDTCTQEGFKQFTFCNEKEKSLSLRITMKLISVVAPS